MNKVINERLYDTETAISLSTFKTTTGIFHDKEYIETLFRKKTEEYFLYTKDGSKALDDLDKERITPLSVENAKKWAEKHLSGKKYIEIFGEVQE